VFEAMEFSFLSSFGSLGMAIMMFFVMLAAYYFGSLVSTRFKNYFVDGFGPVEGSLLGLLALLLAFTFSMSAARYDARRAILIQEANNIGTAILRADLYEPSERAGFRADFKEYVETRIEFHEVGFNDERIGENLNRSDAISTRIWARAARLAQDPKNLVQSNQMIPALNDMIDVLTTRNAIRHATVPDSIIWVLFVLCAVSSFMIGINRKESKSSMMVVNAIFALMISSCIFLIIDLDRPTHGLITLEGMNQNIVDLRGLFDTP
jgi:hypothetical protein